jgi:general secretion pathway protein D
LPPNHPNPSAQARPGVERPAEQSRVVVPLSEALQQRGDLTLRNAPMETTLFTIREIWKINIVAGKGVTGTINCVFHQAPLKEVLDAILLANGYSYRAVGQSLVVQAVGDIGSGNPLFRSATLPIEHSDLDELVDAARLLASSEGQVRALQSARSVLVVDYEDRVASIEAFITQMEKSASSVGGGVSYQARKELEVAYFHTQFIPAETAKTPLLAVLSPQGRVATMPTENRLIVVDYAPHVEMARRVLARIDRPRPQVRITALIYDLSLEDVEQLGLNWNGAGKGRSIGANGAANQALEFDTSTLAPFAPGAAGGTFTVRSLTRNFDINTVLLMLQNANDARLLADPNVTVMDNELAEWKSVSEIPYQQITQSELGGQIGTTAFKEAGITLRVQPTIAADGTIEMLVEPEFSRLAGFTPQENQPIIDTRRASTTVRVANRQTLVLGGLRQRSDTGEFNGIPFLKDVKYFGPLFRSRDTNVRESELIVFIMPEVVGYDDPLQPRQYRAVETVACRLSAIPVAEGCPSQAWGDHCVGGIDDDTLIALPPVEDPVLPTSQPAETLPRTPATGTDTSAAPKQPLRRPFTARFRAP